MPSAEIPEVEGAAPALPLPQTATTQFLSSTSYSLLLLGLLLDSPAPLLPTWLGVGGQVSSFSTKER